MPTNFHKPQPIGLLDMTYVLKYLKNLPWGLRSPDVSKQPVFSYLINALALTLVILTPLYIMGFMLFLSFQMVAIVPALIINGVGFLLGLMLLPLLWILAKKRLGGLPSVFLISGLATIPPQIILNAFSKIGGDTTQTFPVALTFAAVLSYAFVGWVIFWNNLHKTP